ncbi:P-type conjugative transfer protein TrbL [Arcobacter lacus]|uniref:P-type conjugative transfer protein TrbL n=1 Tax=Arcobacter lacus TaxID=1912876 RepID=UPI0021BAE7EC|nr:P-type conjugative transfer protein TrbL [Arcobacter lacus]MCT7910710.1 P-type conjugative transfer protein TrbL [Arcobacter lacus]
MNLVTLLEKYQKTLTNNLQNILKKDTFFKCLFLVFLLSNPALAVEGGDSILKLVESSMNNWIPIVKTACLYVFFALATINLVWTFGMMALRGFELGEFLAELVKKILYIGIFIFLFNVDYWLNTLLNSFIQLATNVSGQSITPSNIISSSMSILKAMWDAVGWNIPKTLFLLICGLITLIAFLFMAIDLLLAYIKFYLINVVAFFALALGGLEHFKQIGLNPILTAIKVGIELFLLMAFMAIINTSITGAVVEIKKEITIDLVLDVLVMSMIFAVISKLIPTVVEATFQGSIGDSSAASAGFKAVAAMIAGMAVGTVAGTIGATRAMKAASALHFAEGGKSGMDAVKGMAKNLANSAAEHWTENTTKGRTSNQMANRLQSKVENIFSKQESGEISGNKNEPYQSGIDKG